MFVNKPSVVKYIVAGNTVFPFEFKFYNNTDIKVYYVPPGETPDDEQHILVLNTDYTVTSEASKIGGSIDISAPLVDGGLVTVARVLPTTRTIDYADRGAFKAQTMDEDQNYQTYLLQDQLYYSQFFLRSPIAGAGSEIKFPPPLADAYLKWNGAGDNLENDTEPPVWRDETLAYRDEAGVFAQASSDSADASEASHQATIVDGAEQVALATEQVGLATDQVVLATEQADEIKAVGVVSPVTSVPLLPNNETGVPTVSYDPITGLFSYGIPVGKTGEPAQVVTPVGGATVAELNALVADPVIGAGYWITGASGTVTYGSQPTDVVAEDMVIWVSSGYFYNIGQIESGDRWELITGVTVNGYAPVDGDDLLPTTGGTMSGDLTIGDGVSGRSLKIRAISVADNPYISLLNQAGDNLSNFHFDFISGETQLRHYVGGLPTAILALDDTNNVSITATIPVNPNHLTRKDYVDAAILALNPVGSVVLRMDTIDPATIYGGTWGLITGDASLSFGDGTVQDGLVDLGANEPSVPLLEHTHIFDGIEMNDHDHDYIYLDRQADAQSGSGAGQGVSAGGNTTGSTLNVSAGTPEGTNQPAGDVAPTLDVRGSRISINVWQRLS